MIKIKRSAAPKLFGEPLMHEALEKLHLSSSDTNSLRTKVDPEVLHLLHRDLVDQFNGRCAFCETHIKDTYAETVHFRPATGCRNFDGGYFPQHYWWLAYEWRNLYLSCSMCSKYRRDLFPVADESLRGTLMAPWKALRDEGNLLLDPCEDNPEDYLHYDENGLTIAFEGRGQATIEAFGLNRPELVEARKAALQPLRLLLQSFKVNPDKKKAKEVNRYITDILSDHTNIDFPGAKRQCFKLWLSENQVLWDRLNTPRQSTTEKIMAAAIGSLSEIDFGNTLNEGFRQVFNTGLAATELPINVIEQLQRFTIKSIHIRNLRSIRHLDMELLPSDAEKNRESWLLLLGDNGIGKSSILQAIAMALGGEGEINRLGLKPRDFLRKGEKKGSVTIYSYEQEQPIELQITQRKFVSNRKDCPTFLIAYGATRLLPKGKLQPAKDKGRKVSIDNLFDYSVALKDVNKWLGSISEEDFTGRIAPALADLLDLGDDDKIYFSNSELRIQDGSQEFKIHQISDGYRSIIALGCDIMQTLSTYNGSYHSIQGVVLIDELGNHLHPRWRMKIASSLRRAFPSLQFIVSTHEPLCLRGLSHGEVIVLHEVTNKDKITEIEALDSKVLPDHTLLRIDQLLTSDLFGLINTLGEEKEKQYKEYYNLLGRDQESLNESDKLKLENYKAVLTAKELKGASPQVQALYEIVNENYAKRVLENGFKTQHELKAETIDEVSGMIQSKKFDWL